MNQSKNSSVVRVGSCIQICMYVYVYNFINFPHKLIHAYVYTHVWIIFVYICTGNNIFKVCVWSYTQTST